jgi:hypothetical protein
MTPLAAVAGGLLAGLAGTVSMDAAQYLMYRRAGGRDSPLAWEFPPVDSWEKAPDPGKAAKRLIEGFTGRDLPVRWARLTSAVAHWSYGVAWGSLYGVVAGSLRRPYALYGLPFGFVVWGSDYVILPEIGLYKPIWEYDAETLARDLGVHLAYGAGTGVTFRLLAGTRSDSE